VKIIKCTPCEVLCESWLNICFRHRGRFQAFSTDKTMSMPEVNIVEAPLIKFSPLLYNNKHKKQAFVIPHANESELHQVRGKLVTSVCTPLQDRQRNSLSLSDGVTVWHNGKCDNLPANYSVLRQAFWCQDCHWTVHQVCTLRSTRQSDVRCTAVQSAWSCMDKLARLYVADQLISKFEVGRRFLSICRLTTADYYGPDLFKGWQVGKVWFCWCYAMSI